MRIDFIITELFVGGAERCLTELALGCAANGDSVRVFSLASLPRGEQGLLVERLRQNDIPIESASADHSIQFITAYRDLKRWLAASPPDICQTFLFHANVLGTQAARKAGVANRIGGLRVAEARPLRCRVESLAAKRMSSLVCVSNAVERFAHEKLGVPPSKSVVIPNGVDVLRFSTASPIDWSELGWPIDSNVSIFVGRLHAQKGIDLLQSQVDAIAPTNSNRKLLLIGDGPLGSEIRAWANDVGASRVQVLPWQQDIQRYIKAARLLVLPSRYEGMPNVVLEAMAAGKPVVCSRVEGSEELLAHDSERQSFLPGDAAAMKKLVEQFLSDESLCDQVGLNNQQRVRADFSIPAMVDAYRSHYRQVLATAY